MTFIPQHAAFKAMVYIADFRRCAADGAAERALIGMNSGCGALLRWTSSSAREAS
jgi:hypothetical protein